VATLDGKLVTVDHKMETLLAYEARWWQWEEEKECREDEKEHREAERLCQQRAFYASMCQQVIAHVAAAPGQHHHQLPRTIPPPPHPPPCDPRPLPSCTRSERAWSPSAWAQDAALDAAQQQLGPPPSSPPPPPPPACKQ
jgi:hypothetical protein